jgi:dihydroorotate dehydrogenase (NAD+) catalytic subunit
MNWMDAVEFLIAGARAVQVGTANFVDPTASIQILNGIISYCEENGISDINDLIGSIVIEQVQEHIK